jgi:Stage II sporulation protein E (SpoIIE)
MSRAGLMFLLLLFAAPHFGQAQTDQPAKAGAAASAGKTVQVKLGESVSELTGPWRFKTGDDMTWAQADFDDSGWGTMDLTPPPGSADVTLGISGYVRGWTERGYPGYSGFAWYRLRVEVQGADRRLALKMPAAADDAYQVYVNGKLIGEFGKFGEGRVTAYNGLPESFALPKGTGNGVISIAIRMWMDSATRFNTPAAGGLHGPPVLGYASLIGALVQLDYDDTVHYIGSGFLEALILLMALLMSAALFWLDRSEKAYLWLALVCAVILAGNAIVLSVNLTPWIGQTTAVVLNNVILSPQRIGLWVLFWGYWFRFPWMRRLHWLVWSLVAVVVIGTAMLRPPLYGKTVPVHFASFIVPLLLIVKLCFGVLLFIVAYKGFRRQKSEGWMAATAVLLVFVANYQSELRLIHVKTTFSILGFVISLGTMATVVSLLIITAMLLRRFIYAQRLKEQWKMEIEQAKQVQQVLIPNELPQVKGLAIESEYRPAREVGGDFFQILPGEDPGSVLIVVGDVTGKGMQAGMLVALIVGSVRAAVRRSSDPAEILLEVNEQLCERQHASATCLILRIDSDGSVMIANAGQIPPYLNGKEIEMEGALPAGVINEAEFSTTHFKLKPGDTLILMSDGVVEAQNHEGSLLGFEGMDEMIARLKTANAIANMAQEFGQEDDILVLKVERLAA